MVRLLSFGICRDILGSVSEIDLMQNELRNVGDLRTYLKKNHPALEQLKHIAIAVNEVYAQDDQPLRQNDVVAIIPPVSGG